MMKNRFRQSKVCKVYHLQSSLQMSSLNVMKGCCCLICCWAKQLTLVGGWHILSECVKSFIIWKCGPRFFRWYSDLEGIHYTQYKILQKSVMQSFISSFYLYVSSSILYKIDSERNSVKHVTQGDGRLKKEYRFFWYYYLKIMVSTFLKLYIK